MKSTKIILAALATVTFAGCVTEEKLMSNKVFINDDLKREIRVATDEGVKSLSREMSVGIATPADYDIEAEFVLAPELLDTYREAYYDAQALLLPEAHYDADGNLSVQIKAGDTRSGSAVLNFKNLGKDQGLDYSNTYVLPVRMVSKDMDVLERSAKMYFVIREASLVNVVGDLTSNCAWPDWGSFEKVHNMEAFTMEALFNCHAFNNDEIETIMGIEDHFLIRIGDAQIPKNQIQIACAYRDLEGDSTNRVGVTNSDLQIKADRWYHLSVTFDKGYIKVYLDGRLKAEEDCHVIGQRPGEDGVEDIIYESANFMVEHSDEMDNKPRCFWIGYSYDSKRYLDGMISEVRVWDRVLTTEEIAAPNHFYKLYPDNVSMQFDPSLVAYWKFNEGTGKTVKDYSMYGNDLTADHDLLWYQVALPQ